MYTASTKDNITNDLKVGANRIKNEARQTGNAVRDDLEDAANEAGRKVRGYIDNASEEVSVVVDSVKDQIRSKPIQSSMIALAAGLVLGALLRR